MRAFLGVFAAQLPRKAFFMGDVPHFRDRGSQSFDQIIARFVSHEGLTPRQISFTATCLYVLASWMLRSCQVNGENQTLMNDLQILERIAHCEVADRPGRIEPRVIKRRRHAYKLMQQPRAVLKQKLLNP